MTACDVSEQCGLLPSTGFYLSVSTSDAPGEEEKNVYKLCDS